MNAYPIKTALAVAVAGFLGATGAMAQTYPASPSTAAPSTQTSPDVKAPVGAPSKTDPAKEATTPMGGASATGSMSKSNQDKMAMPARTETADAAWTKLDASHRGYLTAEDVSQLKDFNFQAADKNHDGKIDATEFKSGWASYSTGASPK